MSVPLISVLLPCRDAAPFLAECIESIGAQSHERFEVIAVDDHSKDESAAMLATWGARDPRVRTVAAQEHGLVAALNEALRHASGDFIARMDADDVARPERFARQLRAFEQEPRLAACGTRVHCFPRSQLRDGALRYEQWLNSLTEPAQLERDMFVECPIAHPTLMIRADALGILGGYADHGWPEDYDLVLRLYTSGARLCNVPEVLLQWRERGDRLSRTDARYSEAAFRRCKVHYLLASRPQLRAVTVWGAGPVGKAFAREFVRCGIPVQAFVDVDPRKIGQTIHDARVLAPDQLRPRHRDDELIVAAVSGPVARAEIRAALNAIGMRELTDFVAVA